MNRTTFDNEKKEWSRNNTQPIFSDNMSVGQAILSILDRDKQKIGQISDNNGKKLTNGELRLKTIRAAQNITKLGYRKGDIIAIVAKNSHHLAPIVFAAMTIGCPINTLDPVFERIDITQMVKITKPKLIFCDRNNVATVRESVMEAGLSSPLYTFDGPTPFSLSAEDLLVETNVEHEFVPINLDDRKNHTVAIVCSSGTTGPPKGVCISHAALLDRMTGSTQHGITLCFSTIYWISGLMTLLSSTLTECLRIITTDSFSPKLFLRMVEKYKITTVLTTPAHLALTLKHSNFLKNDVSSIRQYFCGGSIVAEELCEKMRKHLPNGDIYNCYALTETCGPVTINMPPRAGSVGLLCKGVVVKIIDDDGNRCGVGESGEICLKTPYIFSGYYGNDEMTRKAFDADEWLLTGDIGHFDEDGFLYVIDRKKDIMKYCNYHISPSEIESILIEHPNIKQACVVGIPDLICTDLPAAVIVTNNDAQLSKEEVIEFTAKKLSDSKNLRGGVYFVKSLPMTPSGKILKRAVKDIAIQLYNERQNSL